MMEKNENELKDKQRRKKSIRVVHDGDKIKKLLEVKGFTKKNLTDRLGYSKNSINAYNSVIKEISPIGVHGLSIVADLLDVEIFDILKDEYKTRISSVKLIEFTSHSELNEFLHNEEKKNKGRIAIFNSFPGMIYYPEDGRARRDRYDFLTRSSSINTEYYPIGSLLNFGFSHFPIFSDEDKIKAIKNFIDAHDKRISNHVYIIANADKFTYSPFAADCEILGDDYLLITAPFYQNAIFSIRSVEVVGRIKHTIEEQRENIIYSTKTLKMLRILSDCMEKENNIIDFMVKLKKEKSAFFKIIINVLSDKLKAKVQEEIARNLLK